MSGNVSGGGGLGLGSAAASILQRGVELDKKGRFTESLVCYQEGLQLLVDVLKGTTDASRKTFLRKKIEEYMGRAEVIKKHVEEQKEIGNYREQVVIEAGSRGHSYKTVFGRFFDSDVVAVEVEDAYIRTVHQSSSSDSIQCQNFLRLCELVISKCKDLRTITLTTTLEKSPQQARDQQHNLELIKHSLSSHGVKLNIIISETLHDRAIRLSNGWVIKIGRGLDYFKPPENKFSLGFFDLNLRPCQETHVDIFHQKDVNVRRN